MDAVRSLRSDSSSGIDDIVQGISAIFSTSTWSKLGNSQVRLNWIVNGNICNLAKQDTFSVNVITVQKDGGIQHF